MLTDQDGPEKPDHYFDCAKQISAIGMKVRSGAFATVGDDEGQVEARNDLKDGDAQGLDWSMHKLTTVVALFARNLGQNARNRTPYMQHHCTGIFFLSLHTIFYASLLAWIFSTLA